MAERETAQQRMDRLVQQQAGVNFGMQNDTFFGMMHNLQRSGAISNEEVMQLSDELADYGEVGVKGAAAAAGSGAVDLASVLVAIGTNLYNMSQGQDWAWPEDFRNVPASSEWWGKQMGLSKEQTDSLSFIGAGLAISPTRLADLDYKFFSKALKTSKALGGSVRAAVKNKEAAEAMYKLGKSDTEIWKETGWWPDVDDTGKVAFRFYISDADATINTDAIWAKAEKYNTGAEVGEKIPVFMRTDEVLNHDALFELYPEIGGYQIMVEAERTKDGWKFPTIEPGQTQASFRAAKDPDKRAFKLYGESFSSTPRESILHEVNHAVQTVDEITNGASASGMIRQIDNYEIASFMEDIHKNPDKYKELTIENLKYFFGGPVDPDPKTTDALASAALRAIEGKGSQKAADMWASEADRYWNRSRRWLSVVLSNSSEDEIKAMLKVMPREEVQMLAHARYKFDLGEMEAKLTQVLADIDQATIDAMDRTPHQAMEAFGVGKRAEALAPGVSYSDKVDQLLHLYIKPAYSLGEKIEVPVLKNPGPTELERFLGQIGIRDEQLRWMVNQGDLYIWEASQALHDDAAKALELPVIEGFSPKIDFKKQGAGDMSPKEMLNVLWEKVK